MHRRQAALGEFFGSASFDAFSHIRILDQRLGVAGTPLP